MSKLNGLILIRKESGMTSHDVVFSLRKIIKDKQVGHIGTLDPLAEGLLVCLVGESVKLSDYLMGANKKYNLTLKLGEETDTWDTTGKILSTSSEAVSEDKIRNAISELTGELNLPVPMYSAKKVAGKKLYEIARASEDLKSYEGPPRAMKFWNIRVLEVKFPYVEVEFECSKGSFVRSWVYTLGRNLGVGATMARLSRLSIAEFDLSNAATLSQLKEINDIEVIKKSTFFLTPWQALQSRSLLPIAGLELERLKSGLVSYTLSDRILKQGLKDFVFCFSETQLVGILFVSEDIEVKRIFLN